MPVDVPHDAGDAVTSVPVFVSCDAGDGVTSLYPLSYPVLCDADDGCDVSLPAVLSRPV